VLAEKNQLRGLDNNGNIEGSLKGIFAPSPPATRLRQGPPVVIGYDPSGLPQRLTARLSAAWTCISGAVRLKSQRCREARASGWPVWESRGRRGEDFKPDFKARRGAAIYHRCAHITYETTSDVVGLVEREEFLATTGRCNGRWNRRQLEMTQDALTRAFVSVSSSSRRV